MIGPDFEATIAAARAGDHAALERLYRDTAPVVLGYLRAQRANDPEDLTSETYVAMVRGISGFDGDEVHFRSWLLTIAHRRMVDGFRLRGRRPEDPTDIDELATAMPTPIATDDQALARQEIATALAAIDDLTDDQRAVLLLRVVADLPIDQVATLLDKPVTAVKALQRRANASLRRSLGSTHET